jgi:putative PIN family toxin of toxin-antitoxin system
MTHEPRVVFDTNVLISAALSPSGKPRRVLDWVAEYGVILSSDETLAELEISLRRPKFEPYVDADERDDYIQWLNTRTHSIEIGEQIQVSRDPDDDKFLELALSGSADVIVSGDDDLLVLHPFRDIPIPSPDAFLESDFVET